MIWAQAAVSFVVWILLGWRMRRSSDRLRDWLVGRPRAVRVALGSVGLVGALVGLIAGLAAVALSGGIDDGALVPWAWIAVTLIGAAFVFFQTIGAAAMITLILDAETRKPNDASDPSKRSSE